MKKPEDTFICPYCQSDNVIRKKQAGYAVMLSIMLFFLPLPLLKKSYYCFDCGKEWK